MVTKTMPAATLKALQGSIKKWERIVASPKALDKGGSNCPLCRLFAIGKPYSETCIGCPVMEKTERRQCMDTPFSVWVRHSCLHTDLHTDGYLHRKDGCKECLRLAKAELAFLKKLLPKKPAARRGKHAAQS